MPTAQNYLTVNPPQAICKFLISRLLFLVSRHNIYLIFTSPLETQMTDNQILQKIRANDKKVIAEFYKSCRNEFIGFATKNYAVNFSLAKEIFQEAFLAMYRNICDGKLVELKSSLKTYLFQIGRNLISNEMKKDIKHLEVEENLHASWEEDNPFDKHEDRTRSENFVSAIKSAMDALDEKCRQLLHFFYFEKKKYDEILLIMNYSTIDSLKTQKYKCFKKLENFVKNNYTAKDFFLE